MQNFKNYVAGLAIELLNNVRFTILHKRILRVKPSLKSLGLLFAKTCAILAFTV